MFSCDPCPHTETSDSKSSVVTLARSLLFAAIGVAALVLIFTGRRGGEGDNYGDEVRWDDHEN